MKKNKREKTQQYLPAMCFKSVTNSKIHTQKRDKERREKGEEIKEKEERR